MKKSIMIILLVLFVFAGITLAQTGTKKKRALPYDYGKVIINTEPEKSRLAPVVFDHWVHRAKFTCRVCHVDIGFAMKVNGSKIKASDNMSGYYCGTCHNGKMLYDGKRIFGSCEEKIIADDARCDRCHSFGKEVKKEYDFQKVTGQFPRQRFGNGIDWEKAEEDGLIKLVDYIEGVSIKRKSLTVQKDFSLAAKVEGMPEIIFSHKKHTVWNGCELCHPEIFLGVKKGSTKYSMIEIFDGKFCGVCHTNVAFPLTDCQRCHVKPV